MHKRYSTWLAKTEKKKILYLRGEESRVYESICLSFKARESTEYNNNIL